MVGGEGHCAQLCPTLLLAHGWQPARLPCPWDFHRQEYWSELPFPPPGDLPHPGIRLVSLASLVHWQADSLPIRHLDNPKNYGHSSSVSHSVVSDSSQPHGLLPTGLLCPWDFPGKNTGVGCHALLQGVFPTQGLNPGLLHCRQSLYGLSYQGSPQNRGIWS